MSARARIALKIVVWLVGLAPLGAMAYWFWTDDLTANPIEFVTRNLGDWALRLLLASLAMTPLRLVFGLSWPLTLRRLLGLFAFAYVVLHFGVWIVLDHFFDWRTMADDIVKRPGITVGVAALALLSPLAATSTTGNDQAHGRGGVATLAPSGLRGGGARLPALPLAGQEGAGVPEGLRGRARAAARDPRVGRRRRYLRRRAAARPLVLGFRG